MFYIMMVPDVTWHFIGWRKREGSAERNPCLHFVHHERHLSLQFLRLFLSRKLNTHVQHYLLTKDPARNACSPRTTRRSWCQDVCGAKARLTTQHSRRTPRRPASLFPPFRNAIRAVDADKASIRPVADVDQWSCIFRSAVSCALLPDSANSQSLECQGARHPVWGYPFTGGADDSDRSGCQGLNDAERRGETRLRVRRGRLCDQRHVYKVVLRRKS